MPIILQGSALLSQDNLATVLCLPARMAVELFNVEIVAFHLSDSFAEVKQNETNLWVF